MERHRKAHMNHEALGGSDAEEYVMSEVSDDCDMDFENARDNLDNDVNQDKMKRSHKDDELSSFKNSSERSKKSGKDSKSSKKDKKSKKDKSDKRDKKERNKESAALQLDFEEDLAEYENLNLDDQIIPQRDQPANNMDEYDDHEMWGKSKKAKSSKREKSSKYDKKSHALASSRKVN
jgi:hypothetical protein